jgi:Holliday junction resolvase
MNKAKQKGTSFETEIVNYLKKQGFRNARRNALTGSADTGDIHGVMAQRGEFFATELVIQCKNQRRFDLSGWLTAAKEQAFNHSVRRLSEGVGAFPMLVVKRAGFGSANTGKHYVVMELEDAVSLLKESGYV